jgi:hypothetical protein
MSPWPHLARAWVGIIAVGDHMSRSSIILSASLLAACGAHTGLETPWDGGSQPDGDADSDVDVDADSDADAPACLLPPTRYCEAGVSIESWDFDELTGAPTVVQGVEVLGDGTVVAAGYFGLWRMRPGETWEPVEGAPEALSSSFLSLQSRDERELFAAAFGVVAASPDGGETWSVFELGGNTDVQVLLLDELSPLVVIGGDALLTTLDPLLGVVSSWSVEQLDGDSGTYWENNAVRVLLRTPNGPLYAAERFGRAARASSIDDRWEAASGSPGWEPEVIEAPGVGLLARETGGAVLVSCDLGERWQQIGDSGEYAEVNAMATQLALDPEGVLVAPGLDALGLSCDMGQRWTFFDVSVGGDRPALFDVAPAPDGSIWVAGQHEVDRLELLGG